MATATLYSSVISIETANSQGLSLSCYILNASSGPRSGTFQLFTLDGNSIQVASYVNVAPGGGTGITKTGKINNAASVSLVYAKVTVEGNADDIRACMVMADGKGTTLLSVELR